MFRNNSLLELNEKKKENEKRLFKLPFNFPLLAMAGK